MKIIRTDQTDPTDLPKWERDQVYNGMDVCLTVEILDTILPQLDEYTGSTYDFSRAIQAPVLEMRLRGVLVDQQRKNEVIDEFYDKIDHLERNLERIVFDGVGMIGFNWGSNNDLQALFYNKLGLPIEYKGGRPTVDRNALEKLRVYLIARPIVNHIIAMKELRKKIGVLRTALDPDGRIRTSYNIGGTNTGRLSSSASEFGTGTNLQNIEELLRQIFVSDPGMKFAKFDAAQIQSRICGAVQWNLFKDGRYLDACESGDLHTTVAKMAWPEKDWTGNLKKDREIAETPYYRHYTCRFMCKKLGHGRNFGGTAETLSQETHIPVPAVQDFIGKYDVAFPARQEWYDWTEDQLRKTGTIIALDGRKRQFWGRRNDPKLVRDALAYDAQSTEAYIVNNGMLNIWRERDAVLMMHDHDALTIQYPAEQEDEIIPKIQEQLKVEVPLKNGRTLLVPYECHVGWNKGEYNSEKNPHGLKEYTGHDERTPPEKVHILDRPIAKRRRRKKVR